MPAVYILFVNKATNCIQSGYTCWKIYKLGGVSQPHCTQVGLYPKVSFTAIKLIPRR